MARRKTRSTLAIDWLSDRAIRAAIGLMRILPFDMRRELAAFLMTRIVSPLGGFRRRIRENLALVRPDLSPADIRRLERAVPRSIGRTLAELYSGPDFVARVAREPLQGAGVAALEEAHRTNRPVLLVTGHIGNYDAIRGGLIARGYRVGGLYRPMDNTFFNAHYVAAISRIGTPLFPRGRKGLTDMVRFLRGGGMVGVVLDQSMGDGALLSFFGQPALTSLSPAQMALRYDALIVPTYGIRRPDGGFDMVIEAPIPHTTAEEMTQALNDSLEAQVRAHMDQWLWTHRRWKMGNRT
ncbi:lysophospholipid acyltransferase family protein [Rhodobacteraceae bacterium HSP-20]|uniref:Lysophospholipid acyltransferase family protein n=1 Tax=Paragemmobacter amnigenus TaxID=2852097 RepID=A0ABS6IYJ5_9RHOB|nr:lysophospholipid acyltransferase family protein [Rhodobacter amnigenus]MBU9696589.1 lysophospholipid acyltransferase family protein [Rhodobacter amnigenus]MBV4387816.1 lysophospholipid acyltransferase family protein [Rhodobacter amnigenus]